MDVIILNAILVVFPILIYLVMSCYNILSSKSINRLVFIVTMVTSLYLSLSYNYENNNSLLLVFCNIPPLICYFKKEGRLGVLLSLLVVLVCFYKYDISIILVAIKYILYFIAYRIVLRDRDFNNIFLRLIAILEGFFISFEYFYISYNGISDIVYMLVLSFIIYVITIFCLYMFALADNITELYKIVSECERENEVRNSLFKLTHEIKNPIAVCKGYVDMMNINDIDKTKRYIDIIRAELDRSLNIMNDFMDYSKIKIVKEDMDLILLLDEVYDSFKLLVDSKMIKFNYDPLVEEIYMMGDFNRLKQVFINIIKNSIESIESSGIISIDVSVADKNAIVRIIDNGVGMDSSELSNLKKMFYTTKKNGTGLGVALSNEIVNAHGGSMNYDSVKGEGTICTVKIPL